MAGTGYLPFSTSPDRILVVDADRATVTLLAQMLERAGYTDVVTTQDSRAALSLFTSFEPDLVILGLDLPAPDGFELMRRLRESHPHEYLPVLALTGDAGEDVRERALAGGATEYVSRPYHYSEVLLRVRNLIETRRLHNELTRHMRSVEGQLAEATRSDTELRENLHAITDRIEAVLRAGHLKIVFQPIVDLRHGAIVGGEALARFPGPPIQTPDVWFREADQVGLGIRLEMFAIEKAVEHLAHLPAGTFLAINASTQTLRSPALIHLMESVPADRLVIELTTEASEAATDTDEADRRLRRTGARLAVDDTGSGHASLRHIVRLSPDIIKLDRDLIEDIDHDPARRALTRALVSFSAEIGAMVIAEGIETRGELHELRELGVNYGQGYLFGRPAPLPLQLTLGDGPPPVGPYGAAARP